jgi:hypothetical protein
MAKPLQLWVWLHEIQTDLLSQEKYIPILLPFQPCLSSQCWNNFLHDVLHLLSLRTSLVEDWWTNIPLAFTIAEALDEKGNLSTTQKLNLQMGPLRLYIPFDAGLSKRMSYGKKYLLDVHFVLTSMSII